MYNSLQMGSLWIWESLKGKYRMLKYSGDIDAAVPTKGTLRWIESLNRPIISERRPYFVEQLNAGTITEYDGLTFGIVHDAGHMAPQDKPKQAYHLIFNWLKGRPI
jgi:carboxypeptidase C (cathepsin A)